MQLVQTNDASTIVARARAWENQRPSLARYATYGSLAHVERNIQHTKVERFATVRDTCVDEDHSVSGHSSRMRVDRRFWSGCGDDDNEPICGYVLSYISWLTFWCVELVRARQNDGEGHSFSGVGHISPPNWNRLNTVLYALFILFA